MNGLNERGIGFFQWTLQNSWQAAVLVGLILLAQWLFRKRLSPAWRYGLWFLLLVRLLMPVSPQAAFSVFNLAKLASETPRSESAPHKPSSRPTQAVAAVEETQPTETPVERSANTFIADPIATESPAKSEAFTAASPVAAARVYVDWLRVVFWVWLAGVFFLGSRLTWTNVRFLNRLRREMRTPGERVLRILEQGRAALGLKQEVFVIETTSVETPAVFGLRRKRLLLPEGMVEKFSDDELRHIFLHELAHLKRRDLEVNWLVTMIHLFHWFNPVLWFAFRRMRIDRELATDALALLCAREQKSVPYGETILKVLEGVVRRPVMPGLVGIAEDKAQIKQRLIAISRYGAVRPWKSLALASFAVIAALALTDANEAVEPKSNAAEPANVVSAASANAIADNGAPLAAGQKRFELRVVDYDTKKAFSGVTVKFEIEGYTDPVKTHDRVTDADGKAAIVFDAANLKRFAYRIEKPGYIAPRGEWLKNQVTLVPAQFELKVSQGVEIGGTVNDETGKAVVGAEIFFDRPLIMILGESDYPIHSLKWTVPAGQRVAVTDGAGNWQAKCIWRTVKWAALRIRHPDFADVVYSTEFTKAMEAEGKDHAVEFDDLVQRRARFVLSPGVTVKGRVVNEAGNAMPAVEVRYADRPSENPFWDELMGKGTVTTDAKGEFRIAHLPPKCTFFAVQTTGYAPAVGELDLKTPAAPQIELRLRRGQTLSARVLDHDDQPVSGVRVTFRDWSIWQGVKWQAATDDDGRFQWADAPSEKFQLRLERDGFITLNKTLQPGSNQVIRFNPTFKLTGKVSDATTKEPIPQFRVNWADRDDRLRDMRRFSFEGSHGEFTVDVGKLESNLWSDRYAHEFLVRIEAEGYAPATSRVFKSQQGDVGEATYDFNLQRAASVGGRVLDPDGRPAAGAQVALKTPNARLRLAGKPQFENLDKIPFLSADDKGAFVVSPDPEATHLVAVHERGIVWIEAKDFSSNVTIRLQPWGRIEGTVWEYDKTMRNEEVWHSSSLLHSDRSGNIDFVMLRGRTDEQGRFSLKFVPPGKHRFYRSGGGCAETVEVKAGQTATVKVGGAGRPVVGRFKINNPYVEIDWQKDRHSVHSVHPKAPENLKTGEEYEAWRKQEDVQRAFDSIKNYPMQFAKDGSFRIDEMVPGKYQFVIQLHDPSDPDAFSHSRYIAKFFETFEVADTDKRNSREPLDIGVFELSLKPRIEDGKTAAPEFTAVNMEGKEFKLADFKGKYVLLDFWATWCGPCIAEMPYLLEAHKKFGARNDFVAVSLSIDDTIEKPREFVKKNDMPWRQGYLHQSDVPGKYGVEGIPAIFLINPEGKIIAKDLGGGSIGTQLGRWLK